MQQTPIIAHIPHASYEIPDQYLSQFCISQTALERELLTLTDHFTDQLYSSVNQFASVFQFPVSRFLVDPERFADDNLEIMSQCGMGVLYTHGCFKDKIREYTPEQRQELLDRYYYPHHQALEDATTAALASFNRCLIIDCHSFPEKQLPYEIVASGAKRADLVIGTDEKHTPEAIITIIQDYCKEIGWSCAVNDPFAGCYLPLRYFGDTRVSAVMLEINRKLYLDEATGKKLVNFERIKNQISLMLERLRSYASNPA
jgi:N-formylglutamate deformylase